MSETIIKSFVDGDCRVDIVASDDGLWCRLSAPGRKPDDYNFGAISNRLGSFGLAERVARQAFSWFSCTQLPNKEDFRLEANNIFTRWPCTLCSGTTEKDEIVIMVKDGFVCDPCAAFFAPEILAKRGAIRKEWDKRCEERDWKAADASYFGELEELIQGSAK